MLGALDGEAAMAAGWPRSLWGAVEICLGSPLGMMVLAGPELLCICNRAGAALLGDESASTAPIATLAQRWPQAHALREVAARVLASGQAISADQAELALCIDGVSLLRHVTLACSPLAVSADGVAAGVLVVLIEHCGARTVAGREPPSVQPHLALTARETEILKLIGAGLQVKQVAGALAISVSSVNTYRNRIFRKTGLASNAAVIRYALKNGLVS